MRGPRKGSCKFSWRNAVRVYESMHGLALPETGWVRSGGSSSSSSSQGLRALISYNAAAAELIKATR